MDRHDDLRAAVAVINEIYAYPSLILTLGPLATGGDAFAAFGSRVLRNFNQLAHSKPSIKDFKAFWSTVADEWNICTRALEGWYAVLRELSGSCFACACVAGEVAVCSLSVRIHAPILWIDGHSSCLHVM